MKEEGGWMREDDENPEIVSGEGRMDERGWRREEEDARAYISVVQGVARSSLRFFSAVGGCTKQRKTRG